MFMCSPSSRQRAVTAAPSSRRALLGLPVEHDLQALHAARARARRRRPRGGPAARSSPSCSSSPLAATRAPTPSSSTSSTVLPTDGDERVADVGGEEEVAALVGARLDLVAGDDRGQRQPGAERLGHRDDVRARRRRARSRTGRRCGTARSAPRRRSAASRARRSGRAARRSSPGGGTRTPPLDRIGSTMQAASAPVDCASISAKPRSSWRRQSSSPSAVGRRRAGTCPASAARSCPAPAGP